MMLWENPGWISGDTFVSVEAVVTARACPAKAAVAPVQGRDCERTFRCKLLKVHVATG